MVGVQSARQYNEVDVEAKIGDGEWNKFSIAILSLLLLFKRDASTTLHKQQLGIKGCPSKGSLIELNENVPTHHHHNWTAGPKNGRV